MPLLNLEQPDGKSATSAVLESAEAAVIAKEVTAEGVGRNVAGGTPPVAVVADKAEITID